jgi:hypothetical protein
MPKDIDHIIERLKVALPTVQITQLQTTHLGDDDGLWFIRLPGNPCEVQIESRDGSCPFLIESDFNDGRYHGYSVDEVVVKVTQLYSGPEST